MDAAGQLGHFFVQFIDARWKGPVVKVQRKVMAEARDALERNAQCRGVREKFTPCSRMSCFKSAPHPAFQWCDELTKGAEHLGP